MTGLIAIDESGDLGPSGSKYFSIAAIIMLRPRNLKKASDMLPNGEERKWHNSTPVFRRNLLETLSELSFNVVYTVVNKNEPLNHHPIYGNKLYEEVLREVLSDAMEYLPCKDVNIFLDGCGFIKLDRFRQIVSEEASKHEVNTKQVHKVFSNQNKCIQLVDFIAGASRAKNEYNDDTIDIITKRVSVARRR
ncbi:MAG: DUF3800 domain-containing protein [Candidatus Methanomethylophilaceae archaeon]|nr:DUF3800 domain-containing protein [Candidatus Methanomethylophilaceae archaeon]